MTKKIFRAARHTLIIAGFALYALSMVLPALHTRTVPNSFDTLTGIECLLMGAFNGLIHLVGGAVHVAILCILGNILMGGSIICVLIRKNPLPLRLLMFLQVLVIPLATGFPEFFDLEGTIFLSGYYVWFASFVFIATGLSLEGQEVGDQKVISVTKRSLKKRTDARSLKEADGRALPI
ncbi:MAG TPA: hypothetical protein VJ810_15145 [Blastocatellia bacterium]|nr:hypothetical protein [Blastocatellia bacterium]